MTHQNIQREIASPRKVQLLGLGLILLIVALVLVLVAGLPEQVPLKPNGPVWQFDFFNWTIIFSQEQRVAILVVIAGAIGSTLHVATSFSKYLGNRKFYSSWIWWYLLRPFIGGLLSLMLYFAIRGGIMVNGQGVSGMSIYGILSISALAGLFSKQAIEKLGLMFNKFFSHGESPSSENLTSASDAINVQTDKNTK